MRESSQNVRIERHRVAEDLVALTFADAAAPVDAAPTPVFVLHGLGSRKERHLDLCLRLADAGFLACAIDARSHGERATADMRQRLSDIHAPEFLPAFGETVRGTVGDVAAVATYFGVARYGIVGHSMGGFIGLQTAIADRRVAAVACVSGALDLSLADNPAAPQEVRSLLRAADPATRASELWPRPILLLHGDADQTVPIAGARRLYAALQPVYASRPEFAVLKEYPGAGHDLIPEMAAESVAWITRHLSGASQD